jgi:uncharacterized protein with NRDE domain
MKDELEDASCLDSSFILHPFKKDECMCLLALFHRVVEDAPLVVGANREEHYHRGGEPPRILDGASRAVAGLDPVAGGTWLGVNARGLLVAVTNRPRSEPPPQPRSRGLLVRDLLDCPSVATAVELASRELSRDRYAGCNIVCGDREGVTIVCAGDWLRVRPLPPGLYVLTSRDVNDVTDPRLRHALWWLAGRRYASAADCVAALQELCAQPGNGSPPICLHGPEGGTVSSTVVVLRPTLARSSYLHAQGPPDRTPYADYSHLLRELAPPRPDGG